MKLHNSCLIFHLNSITKTNYVVASLILRVTQRVMSEVTTVIVLPLTKRLI